MTMVNLQWLIGQLSFSCPLAAVRCTVFTSVSVYCFLKLLGIRSHIAIPDAASAADSIVAVVHALKRLIVLYPLQAFDY